MPNKKYTTQITLQNDSVTIVGSTTGSYSPEDDVIYMKKGSISWQDFGQQNTPAEKDETLILIHERQHQINRHKSAYQHDVSLNEAYNRNVHDEITALIAETLEIRRQYQAAQTPEEREAFFAKYANDTDHQQYITALKSGKINPNSTSSKEFQTEMAFIKDAATRYRADPNDDAYREQWTSVAMQHLAENGSRAQSNPQGLAEDVKKMYIIGGFDFNTVGNQKLMLLENQSIIAADNMLAQNADPQKLLRFMQESEGPYAIAEMLDITGLSKEQAEKVMLTAIVTQNNAMGIAEQLCLGETPSMNFDNGEYNSMAAYLRNQIAPYMDLKEDIWEKNNMLTPEGNEEKFNQLMKQAQTVTLDPQAWYDLMGSLLRKDVVNIDEIKARIAQYQGKTININDVVSNMDEFALPFDKVSLAATLEKKAKKEAEDAAVWEEYYKNNPEKKQRRTSDPYQVEITDLEQDLLKDELAARKEEERKVEPLYPSRKPKTYAPLGDGMMVEIKTPEYKNAELSHLSAPDGSTKDVALLDGQKHGAEITRDANGNITEIKVYDHGKEVDLTANKLEYQITEQNGATHEYITLNGEIFGMETITDKNGKTKAAFYEQGGLLMAGAAASKIEKSEGTFIPETTDRAALKDELQTQTAALPATPVSRSQQMRFDFKLENWNSAGMESPTDLFGRKQENASKEPALFPLLNKNNNTR